MSKRPGSESVESSALDVSEPDLKRIRTTDIAEPHAEELNSAVEIDDSAALSPLAAPDEAESSQSPAKRIQSKRKDKSDGWKKSDWRGKRTVRGRASEPWNAPRAVDANGDGEEKKERLAKRKCAVLIGFCGTGYNGMQV